MGGNKSAAACRAAGTARFVPFAAAVMGLSGCGGAGFGAMQSSLGGDLAPGYNTSLTTQTSNRSAYNSLTPQGCYPVQSASFTLKGIQGNPFDYTRELVQVIIRTPAGTSVDYPAFYLGDDKWGVRYTPLHPGTYTLSSVRLNGNIAHDDNLTPSEWKVSGPELPGFIRLDRAHPHKFQFDNGTIYYPLGQDQAWSNGKTDTIAADFAKMHTVGENWSRVWMTAWDGRNLMWAAKPGQLDLNAAAKWDAIVSAAAKNKIYFQMTTQYHGQYSSTVNSNWDQNPWNVKNGGFLQSPQQFFTNPRAIALTKRALYYTIARWGYSPNIMAFELFNEVQWTDAFKAHDYANIAAWHETMAAFIRKHDLYRHLITTSSAADVAIDNPIWSRADYYQVHSYPASLIAALGAKSAFGAPMVKRPLFVGEYGASGNDASGIGLHNGLWAGMMRFSSGAPCYWDWNTVEANNLYTQYAAASAFLAQSGLPIQFGLKNETLAVTTPTLSDYVVAPGAGWQNATQSDFTLTGNGEPAGMSQMPSYLQGNSHRAMMPKPFTFTLDCKTPCKFVVQFGQVSTAGAKVDLSLADSSSTSTAAASLALSGDAAGTPPSSAVREVSISLPAGHQVVTLQNTGPDWAIIKAIRVTNFAPGLTALARLGSQFVTGWVYNAANVDVPLSDSLTPVTGKITVTGLRPGSYELVWFDTWSGKQLSTATVNVTNNNAVNGTTSVSVETPPVTRDVAFYIRKLLAEAAKGGGPLHEKHPGI